MKIRTRAITGPDGRREVAQWLHRSKKHRRRDNHRMRRALIRQKKSNGRFSGE